MGKKTISEIQAVQFGILSDKDVERMSVCPVRSSSLQVEEGSVYDIRLGSVTSDSLCGTCHENAWGCAGHFGHIDLNTPIILFYRQVVTMLKCICLECHRFMASAEELEMNKINTSNYNAVLAHLMKLKLCVRCFTPHPVIRYNVAEHIITAHHKLKKEVAHVELDPVLVKTVFEDVPDEDVRLLGVDPRLFHPRNLVLTKFPVIPTACRPRMSTPDTVSDDDLSLLLADIVKNNNVIKNLPPAHPDRAEKVKKATAAIKFKTLVYCDNSKKKAVHNTNHKAMLGIKERIARKEGHVRKNLMGKRCDQTGRSVVGPDPTLKLHQVAVPHDMANNLTTQEYVTPLNIERLTRLANIGGVSTLTREVRGKEVKINVSNARIDRGHHLRHGDTVVGKDGKTVTVMNTKMALRVGDRLIRRDTTEELAVGPPREKHVVLCVGDRLDRFLQDGDVILLNRQPTLHKNSMQGMEVVRKPGKTLRINLANTKGFNADFDGDEFNAFIAQSIEAQTELRTVSFALSHTLSLQSNKPEIVIVQDSLLAAYQMTSSRLSASREDFMNCVFRTSVVSSYGATLRHVRRTLVRYVGFPYQDETFFDSVMLMSFIFPPDFHVDFPFLTIRHGVVVKGYLDKRSLGGTSTSLLRLLCLEYGAETLATFVNDIQFLTNAWLEINAFSISLQDCVMVHSRTQRAELEKLVDKYLLAADRVSQTTCHADIRESRVLCELNKAKDIGLKLAKDHLAPDNNFISTVASGSKGDYFNIAQITGLLGQQNISQRRPSPTLDQGRRTLLHYPRDIPDRRRRYESRGFVASSFIGGLNPREMFFHAMSGREGMINTTMETRWSGYRQRRTIKMNEDIKVAYDGTVRDAHHNIYSYAYGNEGFDPTYVTYHPRGDGTKEARPCEIARLAEKLNTGAEEARPLTEHDIRDLIKRALPPPSTHSPIPHQATHSIRDKHVLVLRRQLERVSLEPAQKGAFLRRVERDYHRAVIAPGEMVGILGAQSIGERQTQMTLNTFHTAGKLRKVAGVNRYQELINTTKNLKCRTCTIRFRRRYPTARECRDAVGSSLVHLTFQNVIAKREEDGRFVLDMAKLFAYRLTPCDVIRAMKQKGVSDVKMVASDAVSTRTPSSEWLDGRLAGIPGIEDMFLEYEDKGEEWVVTTHGSNLRRILAMPIVDPSRVYCNDLWEVYDCLGVMAAKRMLLLELKESVGDGINDAHLRLVTDKIMFKGRPTSVTRYSMRINDVGALSKATFEESIEIITNAAMKTETDRNSGVSAAIISGNQPKIGTGYMGLRLDIDKMLLADRVTDKAEKKTPPFVFVPPPIAETTYY